MIVLKIMLLLLALGYLLLSACVFFSQKGMVYYPVRELVAAPSDIGLDYEEVRFENELGTRLHGWWLPHDRARFTLLFCHGNGGNVSHRLETLRIFHDLGLSVFLFDYSGYGLSGGTPSEKATRADARAAWRWLVARQGISPDRVVVFGRSLGGGVASALAGELLAEGRQPVGLILESTFTSLVDMGKRLYPWLPVRQLARFRYESVRHLDGVRVPALVIHSPQDDVVPFALGRSLYEGYQGPKWFLEISGNHNVGYLDSGSVYTEGLERFLARLKAGV
ncbi:alpha/beta hydrolase [Salidesulfovibrio onnuriiensis]|uniref:alpha/beta hydrolase n=1 Tax=Salidesulfovibrio onnuriiensis TaxID=2583823 RepID=UPI0011CBFB96|nr:alpha/beta hydrolase [Salidesulfovibrio onnuriiensis]